MGKSNSYYMQLHVEALFTMNEKNELMTIRGCRQELCANSFAGSG